MFQKNFLWGAATAAYQVEGASREDGKGPSIWDEFCRRPGAVYEGQSGSIACDGYHRFREDIALLKRIGVRAYRFSISWPRIFPEGTGRVNEAGLRFYDAVVEECLKNEILPVVTLYHWDLPAALQKRGGWLNPESPVWFRDYAETVARRFAGKVRCYVTINEPQCVVALGYGKGEHAPGCRLSEADLFLAAHHVLLAHGMAVRALREYGGDLKIGMAQCGRICVPSTEKVEDREAAQKATMDLPQDPIDALFSVSFWSDPVFRGDYPEAFYRIFAKSVPEIGAEDFKIISQPLDFYAQNSYTASPVCAEGDGYRPVKFPAGMPVSLMDWPVVPSVLYWGPRFLYERYHRPILISENGMSAHDAVSLDGKVHDPNRVDYLHRCLRELKRAASDGVELAGYFYWSLLDNFEWALGYSQRFGLVYVDYATQRRILKDSAAWYGETIRSNGADL